ncbi:translation initiation factor IF-2 [Gorgonomyces haynaldii]|nr:translation initiation factor IF-2 [Gorgonomyces haynaldii]
MSKPRLPLRSGIQKPLKSILDSKPSMERKPLKSILTPIPKPKIQAKLDSIVTPLAIKKQAKQVDKKPLDKRVERQPLDKKIERQPLDKLIDKKVFEKEEEPQGFQMADEDEEETSDRRLKGKDKDRLRREREQEKKERMKVSKGQKKTKEKIVRDVFIPEAISVAHLAQVIGVSYEVLSRRMTRLGFDVTSSDHVLNADTASLIAIEYGLNPKVAEYDTFDLEPRPIVEQDLEPRPPVVTILGHVDHGKTSLLDALRETSVALGEHGGITQHIGAFSVLLPSQQRITFLDTPGHAAFSAMRERGASTTDIAILVVAADDGVMPQTVEAIHHAKKARVPIIVALTKCDKRGIDVQKVQEQLLQHDIVVEDMAGDVPCVQVSSVTKMGLDVLEETILTVAELSQFKAESKGPCEGVVIESLVTKEKGTTCTVLVKRGTLSVGDIIVAGKHWARVRVLEDETGQKKQSAGPSFPVQVLGWKSLPEAGEQVLGAENESIAKRVVQNRIRKQELLMQQTTIQNQNDKREALKKEQAPEETGLPTLHVIVKADVHGSVDAIQSVIQGLPSHQVKVNIVHSGVGPVTESDVELAAATGSKIISFNTQTPNKIQFEAKTKDITLETHQIIYTLIDSIKDKMSSLLPPEIIIKVEGEADVQQLFTITNKKVKETICGCKIVNGKILRSHLVRIMRGDKELHQGRIRTFKHHKKDITEAAKGLECGIAMDYDGVQAGDTIQAITLIEKPRRIE